MKWFKHLTRSKSDPNIMESEIVFKSQGPYVFWRVLEILADEDAIEKPLIMNFKVFKMWFPSVTIPKLLKILNYFQQKNRILFKLDEPNIEISCFKFSEISSDYAAKVRRESEQCSKHVRTQEVEVEVDKNKKKKKNIIKHKFGEYSHVLLTDEEKEKLIKKFEQSGFEGRIKNLDEALEQYGYKYKSHYLTILKWDKKDGKKQKSFNVLDWEPPIED